METTRKFNNIDELLDAFNIPEENRDSYIAGIVTAAEHAVNNHYNQFKHELEHDDLNLPVVEFNANGIKLAVKYDPHTEGLAPLIKKIVYFDNQSVDLPLYANF